MTQCKRIVWDLGTHEIQNTANYSYQIIDPYLEGCKRYDLYGLSSYYSLKYNSSTRECEPGTSYTSTRFLVNGSYYQRANINRGFNPRAIFLPQGKTGNTFCGETTSYGWQIVDYNSDCSQEFHSPITAFNTDGQAFFLDLIYLDVISGNPPPIKLKIIDGGIESLHSINNKNSVYVEDYECQPECPPNTIDCGDCCLDCNMVFNSISAMRQTLLSRFNIK
ncbi:hypothetical protein WJM97_21950 [Okeanomitos corallinicola TIOX110]|uniref:GON domain-containing protein n=1 Tax=Okeanomitos corallinicola TIOX110 TaxID=3133117 RepID=A0ABZ2UUY5_9CYAN